MGIAGRVVRWIAAASFAFVLAAQPRTARAYEFEHYALTYYIALHMGYTERQAYQIASAAFAIDWDGNTGPMPHGLENVLVAAGGADYADEFRLRRKWRNFHAFANLDLQRWLIAEGKPEAVARTEVAANMKFQMEVLRLAGLAQQNNGAHLHFLQDTFSHGGWADMFGHGPASHLPDFMSFSPAAATAMAEATGRTLVEFRKATCAAHAKKYCALPFRDAPDLAALKPVIDELLRVNPVPVQIEKPDQLIQALRVYSESFDTTPLKYATNLASIFVQMEVFLQLSGATAQGHYLPASVFLLGMPAPNFDRPHQVVVAAVRAQKDLQYQSGAPAMIRGFDNPRLIGFFPDFEPDLPRQWRQYAFDGNGSLQGDPAAFVVEDVTVKIVDEKVDIEKVVIDAENAFRVTVRMKLSLDGMAPIDFMPKLPVFIQSKPGEGGAEDWKEQMVGRGEVVDVAFTQEWKADAVAGKTWDWVLDIDTYSLPPEKRTFKIAFDKGDAPAQAAQCNSAVDSGGDEGGGVTVDLGGFVGKAGFTWEMYDIKDQMTVSVGGVTKTTGCVAGSGTMELDIPAGAGKASVQVLPNCEGTTGTAWVLQFECPLSSTVTADGSGVSGTGQVVPGTGGTGTPGVPGTGGTGTPGAPGTGGTGTAGTPGTGSSGTGPGGAPAAPITTGAGAPSDFAGTAGPTTGLVQPLPPGGAVDLEPNGNPALATPIPPSATVSGVIDAGGDIDIFTIEIGGQGELTVSVPGAGAATLQVGLYPAAGGGWIPDGIGAADDGQFRFDMAQPGRYVLQVGDPSSPNANLAYSFATAFRPAPDPHEPNPGDAAATPTPADGTLVGTILPAGDVDFFRVFVPAAGQWTIETRGLPAGLVLSPGVYPARGGGWLPDRTPPDDGRLVVDLTEPGDYVLAIGDAAGARSVDPYVVALAFAAASDAGEPNDVATVAATLGGAAEVVGTILTAGDVDFYQFEAPAQGEWSIAVAGQPPGIGIGLGVYPARGGGWLPDMSAPDDNRLVVDLVQSGRYLLQVTDIAGARSVDPYRLGLAFAATGDSHEPNDTPPLARMVPVQGRIGGSFLPAGDHDFFLIDAPSAGEWSLTVAGAPADIVPAMGVYPALGGGWLPDLTPPGDGRLTVDLPRPGRYVLQVSEEQGRRNPAPWAADAAFVPAQDSHEPNDAPPLATPIAASGTVSGAILPAGDTDIFIFDAARGGEWSVAIASQNPGQSLGLGVYPAIGGGWLPDLSAADDNRLVVALPGPGKYVLQVGDIAGGRNPASYTLTSSLQ